MFSRHSIWQSLHYSLSGVSYLFREYSFQEELLIGFILWSISLWRIGWSSLQALLTLAWGIVLLTEAFNSAIETIVDLVSPQQHILAKKSKDIASAAVFIAIISGIIVFIFCMTVSTHG
ncbi:MAG: diacylglycerol kinase [Puniceicoccales bacterium]|jgi:diacylglycerol kinase|nr:diacylglycerol kinase [Puniceicoccales bacterium]